MSWWWGSTHLTGTWWYDHKQSHIYLPSPMMCTREGSTSPLSSNNNAELPLNNPPPLDTILHFFLSSPSLELWRLSYITTVLFLQLSPLLSTLYHTSLFLLFLTMYYRIHNPTKSGLLIPKGQSPPYSSQRMIWAKMLKSQHLLLSRLVGAWSRMAWWSSPKACGS